MAVDDKLVNYIREQLRSGFSEEVIREALIQYGYPQSDVKEAFSRATAPEPVKMPPPLEIKEAEIAEGVKPAEAPKEAAPVSVGAKENFLTKNWILILVVSIVAAVAVVGLILFLGIGGLGFGGVSLGGGKDCGTDLNCFLTAFQTCAPATATYTTGSQGSELTISGTLEGLTANKCNFNVNVISATGPLSAYNGKTMKCLIPPEIGEINPLRELAAIKPYCRGTLTSALD